MTYSNVKDGEYSQRKNSKNINQSEENASQSKAVQNNANGDQIITGEAVFKIKGLKTIIKDTKFQDQLRNKGFGEVFNKEYLLSNLEALYLLQNNKLSITGVNKRYDFSLLLKSILKKDDKILSKYLIFRDLRSKGYVVKEGFGFGADFRIYERGEYGKKQSKYVSIGINEGTNIVAMDFVETIEQIEAMGKEAVIGVIERRGEVIYYKTSKVTFFENQKINKN